MFRIWNDSVSRKVFLYLWYILQYRKQMKKIQCISIVYRSYVVLRTY